MKKRLIMMAAASAAALTAAATPAAAAVYAVGSDGAGSPNESVIFRVTPIGGPSPASVFTSPTIVGTVSNIIITPGTYTDDFRFTIPQMGVGSGSITTSSTNLSANGLVFNSVTFNGITVPIVPNTGGGFSAALTGVPITTLATNDLVINFTAAQGGSFGGNLTFQAAAVPETATWAMFLLGFGMLGFALRRKQRTQVRFAF